jgi:hypothetical protein
MYRVPCSVCRMSYVVCRMSISQNIKGITLYLILIMRKKRQNENFFTFFLQIKIYYYICAFKYLNVYYVENLLHVRSCLDRNP